MSAWYVFSAMGFYPVCPGTLDYSIGSPLFSRVVIHLADGNSFTIAAPGNSSDHIYIQSVQFDGNSHTGWSFSHRDILQGSKLTFQMGLTPTTQEKE
jgi:putative alpha-1,2-mannosidase